MAEYISPSPKNVAAGSQYTDAQSAAAESKAAAASAGKNPFAPLAGKKFDEISPNDVVAVIKNLRAILPTIRMILLGIAAGFMALKVFSFVRLYMRRQELVRMIEEEGLKAAELKPAKAARALQKKRYRRYRRNRKVLNILTPKKTRKSSGYRKIIAVMDQLHPKKGY